MYIIIMTMIIIIIFLRTRQMNKKEQTKYTEYSKYTQKIFLLLFIFCMHL